MSYKTFISYKFSEARDLRDKIIEKLGEDAKYYLGETSDSPDLGDNETETIKKTLADMIHGTSVIILIASPNMKKSRWIEWEISYSLKEVTRGDITSHSNGIVAVVMKCNGGYDWLMHKETESDGCHVIRIDAEKLHHIVAKNRYNQIGGKPACAKCGCYDALNASYIAFIKEEEFLDDPKRYIENAHDKMERIDEYNIFKEV